MNDIKYSLISLFSGAGGLDLGFHGGFEIFGKKYDKLNFNIIDVCEIDMKAIQTYNHNFKSCYSAKSVVDFQNNRETDIVLGGFPCQDFSLAGKLRGLSSERGNLYTHMIEIVSKSNAKIFIAENVENLVRIDNGSAILKIKKDFESIGYTLHYKVFDMSLYGIPQTRKRVIIVGIRNDLYSDSLDVLNLDDYISDKIMTSGEAIGDLWNTTELNQQCTYSKAKFRQNSKMQGNKKIEKDKPAPTIRAEHHGNIEGHYESIDITKNHDDISTWRRLTPRECARLQTFPDTFIFPVSASAAYKQIGNAVPPVFAWYLANHISRLLEEINSGK